MGAVRSKAGSWWLGGKRPGTWAASAGRQRIVTLTAVVAFIASVLASVAAPSSAATSLRSVDWNDVLVHDPHITIVPDAYAPPGDFGAYSSARDPRRIAFSLRLSF